MFLQATRKLLYMAGTTLMGWYVNKMVPIFCP